MKEDDTKWPQKNKDGRQELEIRSQMRVDGVDTWQATLKGESSESVTGIGSSGYPNQV